MCSSDAKEPTSRCETVDFLFSFIVPNSSSFNDCNKVFMEHPTSSCDIHLLPIHHESLSLQKGFNAFPRLFLLPLAFDESILLTQFFFIIYIIKTDDMMPAANFGRLKRNRMGRLKNEKFRSFTKIASVLSGWTGFINRSTSNPLLMIMSCGFIQYIGNAFVGGHFRKIVSDADAINLSYLWEFLALYRLSPCIALLFHI